jgi:NSS family neurotransmitter:Na+ symporter
MGQAFFSLSLGVGTILTYASYMRKEENIVSAGNCTAAFDLLFALLAGFAVMPAVFAAGIQPEEGAGLVFDTLPYVFSRMGWAGTVVSVLFFFSILIAALTSSISLLEVGVAYLVEEKGWSRRRSTLVLALGTWALGVLCSLSFGPMSGVKILGLGLFDFLDKFCTNWLMPFGGFLFTLFAGWKMSKADVRDELTCSGKCNRRLFPLLYFLMRYLAPVGIAVIFLTNLFL